MGKTSKSNQAKEGFACSHCYTMVFNCNEVSSRGLCKPCRRLVLVQQLEEMNRAEWKEAGGSGIDGEIGVLLEKIAEKKKRGFVSKEKELNVYRKADSDSEDTLFVLIFARINFRATGLTYNFARIYFRAS